MKLYIFYRKSVYLFLMIFLFFLIKLNISYSQEEIGQENRENVEEGYINNNPVGSVTADLNSIKDGFVPQWSLGDKWLVEATYKDIKQEGDVWLPPIRWVFKVRSLRSLHRQKCYVLHVYPTDRNIKQQAILYLSTFDLRVLKVIDIFPTREGPKSQERQFDPFNPQPLIAENTLVPYDLPIFPLHKPKLVQESDSIFKGYKPRFLNRIIPKVERIGELSFKKLLKQNQKTVSKQYADQFRSYSNNFGNTYQVELIDESNNDTIVQIWQEGVPWAFSTESSLKRVRLINYKTKSGSREVIDGNVQPQEGE